LRDLTNPYDNILTLMEMWVYARDAYNLDLTSRSGYVKLLYWHATGKPPTNVNTYSYANQVFTFADELVPLQ